MAEQPKCIIILRAITYFIIIILSIITIVTIKYDYIYLSKSCITYLVLQISQDIVFTILFLTNIFSEHYFTTFKGILITYSIMIMPFLVVMEIAIYYYMPDNNSFLYISIFCSVIKDILTYIFWGASLEEEV